MNHLGTDTGIWNLSEIVLPTLASNSQIGGPLGRARVDYALGHHGAKVEIFLGACLIEGIAGRWNNPHLYPAFYLDHIEIYDLYLSIFRKLIIHYLCSGVNTSLSSSILHQCSRGTSVKNICTKYSME